MLIENIKSKSEVLFEQISSLNYGDVVSHQSIEKIIGVPYGNPKYNVIIQEVQRSLFGRTRMILENIRDKGYRIVTPDYYATQAIKHYNKGDKMEYIIDKNGQVSGIENCYKFKFKPEDYPNMVLASRINPPIDFTIQNKEQGSTKATIVGSKEVLASMPTEISLTATTTGGAINKLVNEAFSSCEKDIIDRVFKSITEISNSNKNNFGGVNTMTFKKSELLGDWYIMENEINNKPSAEVFADGKTRTRMYETLTGVHILTQDGKVKTIMPAIVKVKPINNRVVIVEFADGTQEKAVLAKEDTFSLEQGISICITKKLLSNIIGSGNGSSVYNKLIDYAIKKYEDDIAYEKELAEIEAKEKQAAEKKERKKQAKEKKQQDKYRQDYIDAICEAVIKAMSAAESKKE